MTLEATLRLGPALMDSVERRAISLPGLVGTKSVFANFFPRSAVSVCLPSGLGGVPLHPTRPPPGLSKFPSPGWGSFRTEFSEAARRSVPSAVGPIFPEERIRFALIFYEAGSFPQRLLVRLGA